MLNDIYEQVSEDRNGRIRLMSLIC